MLPAPCSLLPCPTTSFHVTRGQMTNDNPATATFSTVICNVPCVHDCDIEPESVRILKLLEPEESRGVIEAFPKDSFCSVSEKDAGKHWQERQEFAPLLEPYCFAL